MSNRINAPLAHPKSFWTAVMMNANDIAAHHRSRLAFIYVRQSSPHQVLHHRESQMRQRSFRQRAADLGWSVERITVIDEDLGLSATKRHQDRSIGEMNAVFRP